MADSDYKSFSVRLPLSLLDKVGRIAAGREWSNNKVIIKAIERGLPIVAEADLSGPTPQGPPPAPARHRSRAPRIEGEQPSRGYSGTLPFKSTSDYTLYEAGADPSAQIGEIDRLMEEIDRCADRDAA
ncbi:MAG TPA: hypothetical protein VFH17_08375 [Coriobacteriia bacterium]|nr:hypothetical protein [Coriobacteriia bacterium]